MTVNVKAGPGRALTDILGVDTNGKGGTAGARNGGSALLAMQFGITAVGITTQSFDASSWMTFAAPNTKSAVLVTKDHLGNTTRTFNQANGRSDFFAYSSAGDAAGPPLVVTYVNSTPANGDTLGHYAFRGNSSAGVGNTFAYVIGNATNVTAASLSSALTLGVMQNLDSGAGNAQPNKFFVIDGGSGVVTLPSGFSASMAGNSVPLTASHTSGPELQLTNTSNSRTVRFGLYDSVNATIDSQSGGFLLRTAGTVAMTVSSSGAGRMTGELRSSKTSNYTVLSTDGGTEFDNGGAAAQVDFTLPSVPITGWHAGFTVNAAQIVRVVAPASTTINLGGTASAAAGNISGSQVGAYVHLMYIGGNRYVAKMVTGTGGSTGAGGWTVT